MLVAQNIRIKEQTINSITVRKYMKTFMRIILNPLQEALTTKLFSID